MKRQNLDQLLQLSRLRALKDRLHLDQQDKAALPIREGIRSLRDTPVWTSDATDTISILQQRSRWQSWRQTELRRLQIELARHEATIAPVRDRAVRSAARAEVVAELAAKVRFKGSGGRSR